MPRTSEDTRIVRGLEKRKACDLCHIKKIRCDAGKPTCSHCVIYGAQCAYTPHIKRRRKEVQVQTNVAVASSLGEALTHPESKSQGLSSSGQARTLFTETPAPSLPSLPELLPIIHDYFANLNSITPLFDENTFMRMLKENNPFSHQVPVLVAAVNVILALTYLHRATKHSPIPFSDPETCISNARSIMNSLAAGHHDLLALQVLLGLVMLNLGTLGLSTASSLIGSAIKLAHKLRLHNSRTNALLDDATSLQRARVFWIAYILDRDISFRRCDPPLQQENDHDIAVPYSSQGRGLVRFVTASGAEVYLDLFQTWVHLARIQGDIYEQLYSVRAETQPLDTQRRNKDLIHLMLREWLATIPAELHPDRFSGLSPEPAAGQLVVLYFTYLACFLQTHRVGSHDAEWIARLVNYSQSIVESADPGLEPDFSFMSALPPFIEPSTVWAEVVGAARECIKLFRVIDQDDSKLICDINRRNVACTYIASALVLIANALTVSEHRCSADTDAQLIAEALAFFERSTALVPGCVGFRKMHAACAELSCRARIARARFALDLGGPSKPASVAWLEAEARRSAGHSALALVEAFTTAEVKPFGAAVVAGRISAPT
ncbi:hypothetical protein MGN70_000037 [Eutypa lata]|nr:hypothetical protein MGN70_000037 [Eutypa lata]